MRKPPPKRPGFHADSPNPWGRRPSRALPLLAVAVLLCGAVVLWRAASLPLTWDQLTEESVTWVRATADQVTAKLGGWQPDPTAPPRSGSADDNHALQTKPEATQRQALRTWCRDLAARLASVSLRHCSDRGFFHSGFNSVEGRPIAVRSVPPGNGPARGRVLLIGGTHGDELTSVSLTFWWLELLEEGGSNIHWRVAPAMNPDGVLSQPAQRLNAHGIDLNRNLPTPDWHNESRAYWQEVDYQQRRYPGEAAASEPETRWLMAEIERFRPDVIVALHAPYGVLDYDGQFPPPEQLGDLGLQRLGVFPGSLGNYGARHLGIPVMTVELDHATRMPSRKRARAMWQDLNRWLGRYLASPQQQVRSSAAGPDSS